MRIALNTVRLGVVCKNFTCVETRRPSRSPVAWARETRLMRAGSNFASLQRLSALQISYPNRIRIALMMTIAD